MILLVSLALLGPCWAMQLLRLRLRWALFVALSLLWLVLFLVTLLYLLTTILVDLPVGFSPASDNQMTIDDSAQSPSVRSPSAASFKTARSHSLIQTSLPGTPTTPENCPITPLISPTLGGASLSRREAPSNIAGIRQRAPSHIMLRIVKTFHYCFDSL